MPEKLEKYLKKIREQMDVEQPDDQGIWEGIRSGLQDSDKPAAGRTIWLQIRNIAAVAILFLVVGYFVSEALYKRKNSDNITLTRVDKKLGERENEYKSRVKYIRKEIAGYPGTENAVINEILLEIQQLDSVYKQCLKDLKEIGYDERVINTIFDTYEQKIFLLELIILEYDKTQYYENDETLSL